MRIFVFAVRSKVLDMFNATCDFSMDSGISHYTNKVYDFELGIGSSDTWPRWQGGDYPVVVEYETFCGRYSLEVHTHTHTHTHARTHTHTHGQAQTCILWICVEHCSSSSYCFFTCAMRR